jgi:hypothetical protein
MTEDPPVSTDRLPEDSPLRDDSAFAAECKAINQGLENIRVTPVTANKYLAIDARDASLDEYEVNLAGPSCTCDHYRLHQEESGTCSHVAMAALCKGHSPAPDSTAAHDLQALVERVRHVERELRDAVDFTTTHLETEARMTAKQEVSEGEEVEDPTGEAVAAPLPEEKAAELKAAYDEVIPDMKVEPADGWIYIDTGYETPEEWPGTNGVVDTFDVVTSDPMEYVYGGPDSESDEDHPAYASKPSQYHDNAIRPEDVDEYIEEVL